MLHILEFFSVIFSWAQRGMKCSPTFYKHAKEITDAFTPMRNSRWYCWPGKYAGIVSEINAVLKLSFKKCTS